VNRHRSRQIFEELTGKRILNRSGRLIDRERLSSYDFKTVLTGKQRDEIRSLILNSQKLPEIRKQYSRILDDNAAMSALNAAGLEMNSTNLRKYLSELSSEEKGMLFDFYVSRIVSNLIAEQIVKYRGILLENQKKEVLVLLYEPVDICSHFYGDLIAFVRSEKPDYTIRIALSYRKAPARQMSRRVHPYVEALSDLENKKYLETAHLEENPEMM